MDAVADTSFVVAVAIRSENYHQACRTIYEREKAIILPQTTLNEVAYMLRTRYDYQAVIHFLRQLPTSKYRLVELTSVDIARTVLILQKYADSRVDFVDATIAAVAERMNITRILTLDRRDFGLIRPKHVDRFELLPEPN